MTRLALASALLRAVLCAGVLVVTQALAGDTLSLHWVRVSRRPLLFAVLYGLLAWPLALLERVPHDPTATRGLRCYLRGLALLAVIAVACVAAEFHAVFSSVLLETWSHAEALEAAMGLVGAYAHVPVGPNVAQYLLLAAPYALVTLARRGSRSLRLQYLALPTSLLIATAIEWSGVFPTTVLRWPRNVGTHGPFLTDQIRLAIPLACVLAIALPLAAVLSDRFERWATNRADRRSATYPGEVTNE